VSDILQAMALIKVPDQVTTSLKFTFDCMGIAEKEIAAGKKKCPKMAEYIDKAFAYLMPPGGFEKYPLFVYQSYVKEQIERMANEIDIDWATDTEILITLSNMMLRAPLSQDYAKLAMDLFEKVFPEMKLPKTDQRYYESYRGATKEVYRLIRNRLGLINRKRE
jgi:hypothetical protein